METTFCELRGKEVINICDGKRLGRIIDIVFETNYGKILGFVVPCYNKSWNIFKTSEDIFIPFCNVRKIGDDVILVDIFVPNKQPANCKKGKCATPYSKTAVLSTPQNNISNNTENQSAYISNEQNSVQINTNVNQQNTIPIYPKDINQ